MTQNHTKGMSGTVLGLEGRWEGRAERYDSMGVEDTHIPRVLRAAGGWRREAVYTLTQRISPIPA